jgi:IS5 family transposase
MLTCKSPRKVMGMAYRLAQQYLPDYAHRFSRHDFTLPQLFACLVVREQIGRTYRGTEALLRDCPHWCRDIGMKRTPDHATLHRAMNWLSRGLRIERLMEAVHRWFEHNRLLGKVLAIDSTLFDTHHRSRHYEQRVRHQKQRENGDKRRSRTARATPKLIVAADVACHVITAARTRRGMGSDAPDFAPLLEQALRRGGVRQVLADAGYDCSDNHKHARARGVSALIKTGIGRPTSKPAACPHRRRMQRILSGSQAHRPYGRRAQVETVMSMLKRNLGDALRCRTPRARQREMLFRVLVHNIMIRRRNRGSRQGRYVRFDRSRPV